MTLDRLAALLQRFSVSASMFHSGPLCGVTDFSAHEDSGQLHLVRSGSVRVQQRGRSMQRVEGPSLIFYPRPCAHRFVTDARSGAAMACANVRFASSRINPIARALPELVVLPLEEIQGAAPLLEVLFDEAFATRCGRQPLVDRLFEAVLILILRRLLDVGAVQQGLLAGLSHAQLARALVAMHESPAQPWTLDAMAQRAAMSRSHFAAVFAARVGATPGDYLARFRISLAQDLMLRGTPVAHAAEQVGYGSAAAFSRAFSAACGASPRRWRERTMRASATAHGSLAASRNARRGAPMRARRAS